MKKEHILSSFEYLGYYIVGLGLIVSGLFYAWKFNVGWGSILLSLGVFVIAWGISRKSSVLSEDVAKASLYETLGRLEDRRLAIRDRFEIIMDKLRFEFDYDVSSESRVDIKEYARLYTYSVWKCKEYLDEALFFKKYFTVKEENKIIHFIDNLYQDLCNGKKYLNISLKQEYIRHLEIMYDKIQVLDAYKKDSLKDEARRMRLKNNLNFLRNDQTHHISYFKHSIIF